MLSHLKNKITALEKFSFEDERNKVVNDNKNKLADLQRGQLASGIDSESRYIRLKDNSKYGYGYRPFTINQKMALGKGTGAITNRVTWFMEGNFHASIRAFIHGDKFSLKSPDSVLSTMLSRSGEDAVGLNEDSRKEFALTIVRPAILDAYDKKVRKI